MSEVLREVVERKRFNFGKNWNRFLTKLDEGRIQEGEKSLKQMLEVEKMREERVSGKKPKVSYAGLLMIGVREVLKNGG